MFGYATGIAKKLPKAKVTEVANQAQCEVTAKQLADSSGKAISVYRCGFDEYHLFKTMHPRMYCAREAAAANLANPFSKLSRQTKDRIVRYFSNSLDPATLSEVKTLIFS